MEDSDDSKSAGTDTGDIQRGGRWGGEGGRETGGRKQVISFSAGAAS